MNSNILPQSVRVIIIVVFLFNGMSKSNAQESRFYMPIEIQKAYKNGTRSFDGNPGANYWQNSTDYNIDVEIVTDEQMIVGSEEVVYHNYSPDTIFALVVRLYHDANKKGTVRSYETYAGDLTNGVQLFNLKINGKSYNQKDKKKVKRRGTNIKFILDDPLLPGERLKFNASWKQEIPTNDTRVGSYDSTTFFIGYWYPQVAVYDDVFGWDELNHDILNEYYNGPANFKVSVNAPEGYMVWGTGTLTNAREVYPSGVLEKYKKAWSSKEVISIVSGKDMKKGIQTKRSKWNFEAKNVSDFAFFLSNHFLWDAASVPVDGKKVLVSTVHPQDTFNYHNHVKLSLDAMKCLSEDTPGIPYPFEVFTTVISDGWGMEFPMMAHNGSPGKSVTVHEMLHSYVPMYVHTNETRWAWMDEGLVSLWTQLVLMKIPGEGKGVDDVIGKSKSQENITGTVSDLPLFLPSEFLKDRNIGYAAYGKPTFLFASLQQYLGDELFIECCREYIKRWALKSPTPYDFFYTFENITDQDLSWIWKPWFFEFGYPDVKIESFKNGELTVALAGNQPVPLVIELMYNDGTSKTLKENIGIWRKGKKIFKVNISDFSKVKEVAVNKNLLDADYTNNVIYIDQ